MDTFFFYWALDLPDFASEYINVKYFVVIFQAVFRWCNNFLNKKMIMYSDNASHVSWLNKVISRKPLIYLMFRILFWIFAIYNYAFSAQHLPGKQNNIADACSRLHEPSQLNKLYLLVPSLQYDTFSFTTLFVVAHVITIFLLGGFASNLKRKRWASSTAATYPTHMKFYMDLFRIFVTPNLQTRKHCNYV